MIFVICWLYLFFIYFFSLKHRQTFANLYRGTNLSVFSGDNCDNPVDKYYTELSARYEK